MTSLPSQILMDCYTLINKLGEGTFAQVHSAIDQNTNEKVAIKQVYILKSLIEEVMSEFNTIRMLQNDHIISYKRSFYDSSEINLNLVMELCCDSLRGQIQDRKPFETRLLQSFLVQMVSAFLQLQNKELMHLDLKPQNILIANEEGTLFKLCDFGCFQISHYSKISGYDSSALCTFNYLAPDLHFNYQGKKSRSSADVWSLGVTLYQMIFWKLPFAKQQIGIVKRRQVQDFFNGKFVINYEATSFAPTEIINVIKMMLRPIPIERITWKQLRDHLVKSLKVDEHQFMNMKELLPNFNKITELLLKAARTIKAGIDKAAPFWKIGKAAKVETFESLVHYTYLSAAKFSEHQHYRWHLAPATHRSAANQLIKEACDMEKAVCKQNDIDEFEVKDFNYIEMIALEKIEALRAELYGQKGELQFICAVFTALAKIITNSEGLFTTLTPFERCFQL